MEKQRGWCDPNACSWATSSSPHETVERLAVKPISWPNLTAFLSLLNTHAHTNCQSYVFIFYKVSHKMKLLLHEIEHPDTLKTSFHTPNKNLEFVYETVCDHLSPCYYKVSPNIFHKVYNKQISKLFHRSICYIHKGTILPRNCYMPLL